jgi:hypothetical protein
MLHDLLREVSLRGAAARLGAFTYLALGVSLVLARLFSPYHDHHLVRHATFTIVGLVCPLIILFARSVAMRWIATMLLVIAFAGCTLLPELQ